MQNTSELTEREREILRLIATGITNKDIARQLFISSNTVKVHLRNIFAKIGVSSRTEAALYAIQSGLSQSPDHRLVEPATRELAVTTPLPLQPKRHTRLLWVGALLAVLLVGSVITYELTRHATPKVAIAAPIPVPTAPSRWQELAAMPTARSGLAVAAYENRFYAIGGETTAGVTGMTEQYDVAANTWAALKPKPLPVTDINAGVIGGKIYIAGGRLASGGVTAVLESYDPGRDLWETHAALPVALSGYALAVFEGKLYLFGGWDGHKYLASVYEYEPDQDTWSARAPMPYARAFAGAAAAGGEIYVLGGYDGTQALDTNAAYLPSRDAWQQRAPLPARRYAMGVASLADFIYAIGGIGDNGSTLPPLQYVHQQDQWQTFENPPFLEWSYLGLVPLQTRLYAMGGHQNGIPVLQNLSYQAIYTIVIPVFP